MNHKHLYWLSMLAVDACVVVFILDSWFSMNNMNVLPIAEDAVVEHGWDEDALELDSFETSDAFLGSSAIVHFRCQSDGNSESIIVVLQRPFLCLDWKAVTVEVL